MKKHSLPSTMASVILLMLAIAYLYPLFLVVINSFKTFSEITSNVLALPKRLVWENFQNAFKIMNYPRYFLNTLLATTVGVCGVVLASSLAGYKLSRTKTRYSFIMFMILIAPMMIPFHSFMISLVKVAKELHLIGSPLGLGVLYGDWEPPLLSSCTMGLSNRCPRSLMTVHSSTAHPRSGPFFRLFSPCCSRDRLGRRHQHDVDVE